MNTPRDALRQAVGERLVQEEPRLVVMAEGVGDVQRVIQLANEQMFQVLVLGSGSSFPEDLTIPGDTVALMMSRSTMPLEWDEDNLTVTVGAGTRVVDLSRSMESAGWEYRFLEGTPHVTVGGAIAGTSALESAIIGSNFRIFTLGMKIVHSEGQLVQWGGKMVKDVAGLDVASSYVGSGGAIGVIAEVTFRLVPFPSPLVDTQRRDLIQSDGVNPPTVPSNNYLQRMYRTFDPRGIFYRVHRPQSDTP
jgi:FAD/FMN-containing dehydrogenase